MLFTATTDNGDEIFTSPTDKLERLTHEDNNLYVITKDKEKVWVYEGNDARAQMKNVGRMMGLLKGTIEPIIEP